MLKLEPVSAEPFWLDVLPGVRIQFRPVSVAAMLIARNFGIRLILDFPVFIQ